MAVEPYRAISWSPYEPITDVRMNQSETNLQWIHDNTPRALWTGKDGSSSRREGLKIASGKALFSKRESDRATTRVRFGQFFSEFCEPNLATTLLTTGQRKIFHVCSGLDGALHPDHRGFEISVEVAANNEKQDSIVKQFYVSWIALGY